MQEERPPHKTGRPPSARSTAVAKFCRRHGWVAFHLYRRSDGRTGYKCKRCVGEAVTRRHRKVRAMLLEQAGGRCAVCGYSRCSMNLHFHHVDPATKSFPMSMCAGKVYATYQAEARKCVLVCANCHGEIESGMIASPPPQARFRALEAAS